MKSIAIAIFIPACLFCELYAKRHGIKIHFLTWTLQTIALIFILWTT